MAQKPVKAKEYYALKQGQEKEYVRVYAARAVRAGEPIIYEAPLRLEKAPRAIENGYELCVYNSFSSSDKSFLSEKDFAALTVPADKLPLAAARAAMTKHELAALTPVAKGELIFVNEVSPFNKEARYDGFIFAAEENKKIYLSNYELTAVFNNISGQKKTHADVLIRRTDETALQGIVLTEDVTFKFKEGKVAAPKGSFLYKNVDDVDGYTLAPPEYVLLALRQAHPITAEAMKTSAGIKTRRPLTIKRKP